MKTQEELLAEMQQQVYAQTQPTFQSYTGVDPLPFASQMSGAINPAILDFALSNDPLIADLERQLKGVELIEEIDEKSGELVSKPKQRAPPMLNDRGIFFIKGYLATQIYRNTMLSNLTEKEVMVNNIENSCVLSAHLIVNRHRYGHKLENHDAIMDMVENVLKYAATRGIGRGEALSAYGSRKINEVNTTDQVARLIAEAKNKGIFG